MRHALIFLLLLPSMACNRLDSGNGVTTPQEATLQETVDTASPEYPIMVELHPGESATLPHDTMVITFERVTGESRCPIGVVCVWEGDGAVKLVLQPRTAPAETCTLHTTLEPKSIIAGTSEIRLKELSPYPVYGKEIDPSEYLATLEIKPAPR